MDERPDPAAPTPADGAPPSRRRWPLVFASLAAVLVLVVASLLAFGWWAIGSERGSAWLLSALPGVHLTAPKGRLLGDFEAERLTLALPGGTTLEAHKVGWRGLRLSRAAAPTWFTLTIDELHAGRLDVLTPPTADASPPAAPTDLHLPFALDLRTLVIDELHVRALGETPVRALTASVQLGANAGAEHRIDRLAFRWDRLQAEGRARLATRAPLALDATLALLQEGASAAITPGSPASAASAASGASAASAAPPSAAALAWRANATLSGPLAAPVLQATASARPSAERPAQSLEARATLKPFERWPLGDLRLRTSALDLSAFSRLAPMTALTGSADATSTGADQPAQVRVALTNALPGRWNEGRLPVRSATLDLLGRPDQPGVLTVQTLVAELGTPQSPAGRITGAGRWTPERWNVDATLAAVQPARLDARAPAMQLTGTVALVGAAAATSTAFVDSIDLKAALAGTVTDRGSARPVQLALDAGLRPQRLELRELQLRSGPAHASASGSASQAAPTAPWALKGRAALTDFDPALWWPGSDGSAWRKATNRLNASATFDLAAPAGVTSEPAAELLHALRGEAELTIAPSVVAGVPLTGTASARSAAGNTLLATVQLDAAGNALRAQGRVATLGSGADDAWDLTLAGPALDRLGPLVALFGPLGADARLAGSLNASAHVAGRWPQLASNGQLDASALRIGNLSVQGASGRWRAGSSANAPVEADLTITKAATGAGGPSVDSARLQLQGTARAHTLTLRAEARALPPAWTDALVPSSAASGPAPTRTVATMQASGGIVDGPKAPLAGWRGEVQQLELRAEPAPAGAAPLLLTRNVRLEAMGLGGPARVDVQPGRAEVLGAVLRWSRIAWQAGTGAAEPARIDAEAELEPLRIAPLLARLQPDFGWGGDLTIGGRLVLHSAPGFAADVVIERRSGDLTVTDELGTQALGLTDLRVSLAAQDGVWNFTQALAGTHVGVGAGAVVVRTSPQAVWPPADAPLEGVIELRVARLATWGTWVPPGWRIDGALRTSASFGGRFGAPQYTGEIVGSQLSVRNFLQGVNVSDGEVAIRLQGTSARIERFTARGGSGTLSVAGEAGFGDAPQALVTVTAERFQLLGRVDRRIVTSGQARVKLDAKNVTVDGKFDVDEGLVDFTRNDAPTLADDVEVRRGARSATAASAATPSAKAEVAANARAQAPALPQNTRRDVALDLRVTLGQRLRIRGRGLDTGLRGELHITSPAGRLAVNGTVQAVDGTYAAYGQKLAIDRGLVVFTGEVGNPRLDIEATRPNLDIRVGVAVTGSAANPRVRLFSEPELSELDKLSWLVMGRASDGLGRTDTALLQRAALALLAGEGGGLTDQFTRAIGLDELSVRQTDGEVRETVIALGKQLSQRWYVGYERGLNATAGSWQLVYRIARRFTLRAQAGDDNSLDLIWTWRWN